MEKFNDKLLEDMVTPFIEKCQEIAEKTNTDLPTVFKAYRTLVTSEKDLQLALIADRIVETVMHELKQGRVKVNDFAKPGAEA